MVKKIMILLAILPLLMIPLAKGDTAWCNDAPECPDSFSAICQCESTQTGVDCYRIVCKDLNNDGCLELDWINPIKCPHLCEQISQYRAECVYEQPPCDYICDIGDQECVGAIVDPYLGTKTSYRVCMDEDNDGCGEWAFPKKCPPNWACLDDYCQNFYEPPPLCQDSCANTELKRCHSVAQSEYVESCDDWDNDGCLEWWSEVYPETVGMGLSWCEFGCDEPYPQQAICFIEPETPESDCELGDTKCITGYDEASCVLCYATGYYTYVCNGTANVTHCEYGCEQITTTETKCNRESVLRPNWNRSVTINCTNNFNNYPFGMAVIGGYIYVGEESVTVYGDADVYRYKVSDLSYDRNFNLSCDYFTRSGAVDSISGDGKHLYALEIDSGSGNEVITKYRTNGSCIETIVNVSLGLYEGIAITDDYIFSDTSDSPDLNLFYKFDKTTGEIIDVYDYSDRSFNLQVDGMCGYDDYFWWTDRGTGGLGILHKYTVNFVDTGVFINLTREISDDITYGVAQTSNKLYFIGACSGGLYCIYEYDYTGEGFIRDECVKGDTTCSDLMYINGEWMRPYILYCDDYNADGYMEWSRALNYTDVTGTGMSCQYGCHFNTTTYKAECRNLPKPNCTDQDWLCIPDSIRCQGEWIQKCEDKYNKNCYDWNNKYPCLLGCLNNKMCRPCEDICSLGESKCFSEGFGGLDIKNQQSVYYPLPVVVNCTYDYNQHCWTWDIAEIERCPMGCFDNETGGLTKGYCYTKKELEEDYYFSNFTGSIWDATEEIMAYITWTFPAQDQKYVVSLGVGIIFSALITFKAGLKGWKLGILSFFIWTLICSLYGWLPAWWTVICIVASALIIGSRVYGKFGE